MPFDELMLQKIAIEVCHTMLGLELVPVDAVLNMTNPVTASVEIRGSQHRIVDLFASLPLMQTFAASMFCTESENLSEDEIHDAFGEIANMVGGNAKACFGEEAELSQPDVRQTDDGLVSLLQGNIRTSFKCCGHQLTIVLRELGSSARTKPVLAIT